jgi:nucleoid-associated protein YgaU
VTDLQIATALAKACADLNEIRDAARALPEEMGDVIASIGAALWQLESAEEGIRKRRRDARKKPA